MPNDMAYVTCIHCVDIGSVVSCSGGLRLGIMGPGSYKPSLTLLFVFSARGVCVVSL